MAWGNAGRPKYKICRGYGRTPHRVNYNKGFPRVRRKLKDGTVADYAGPLCFGCRRAYERELRRMNTRLMGKATRPQDVPWKKYRKKQPRVMVSSELFDNWLKEYQTATGLSLEGVCRNAGVSSRTIRYMRKRGTIRLSIAEKFFVSANQPYMTHILYGEVPERWAA